MDSPKAFHCGKKKSEGEMREMKRPSNSTVAAGAAPTDGRLLLRNSPIPYLYGGLALMLGLIAIALLILVCSFRRSSSSSSDRSSVADSGEKPTQPVTVGRKIAVIMAGDDNPTYLARPAPTASTPN